MVRVYICVLKKTIHILAQILYYLMTIIKPVVLLFQCANFIVCLRLLLQQGKAKPHQCCNVPNKGKLNSILNGRMRRSTESPYGEKFQTFNTMLIHILFIS